MTYIIQNNAGHYLKPGYNNFTPNLAEAATFDSCDKASKIIKHTLKAAWRDKCKVLIMPEQSEEVAAEDSEMAEESEDLIVSSVDLFRSLADLTVTENKDYQTVEKQIRTLCKTLAKMAGTEEKNIKGHQQTELEICDLYHYIEFNDLNAKESKEVVDKLHDALKRRRKYKDNLGLINIINRCIDAQGMAKLVEYINSLDVRKYTPRVLTDLFGE